MQASRHRNTHTAAAIKHIKLPTGIPGIFKGAEPLKRSGSAPDRYMAFFAKLFFTWKKSGKKAIE